MGHLGTQHDLFLILLNGCGKSGPQLQAVERKEITKIIVALYHHRLQRRLVITVKAHICHRQQYTPTQLGQPTESAKTRYIIMVNDN